ncbi:cell division protein ZapC domain-containing protein [Idiomarina fontislapidosi]
MCKLELNQHMCWLYDDNAQPLSIQTGDGAPFRLPYKHKQLVNVDFTSAPFNIEDLTLLQNFVDVLEGYSTEELGSSTEQAALCATAFVRFGCPQMPQSWHFQKSNIDEWAPERHICELNSGFDDGLFLIIERDEEFASCLLLSKDMQLSPIKTLKQYHVIKVLHNRLLPSTLEMRQTMLSSQRLA